MPRPIPVRKAGKDKKTLKSRKSVGQRKKGLPWEFLYPVGLFLFCLFYLPTFFLKRKSRDHLMERFGAIPSSPFSGKRFWLHVVSLGEALAAQPLVKEIRKRFPEIQFAFSTTTRTGRAVLQKIRKPHEPLFYFPLDFAWVSRRTLKRLRPNWFATLETEIWPNLLLALEEKGIPAFLLNGRISQKSYRRYRWVRGVMKTPLNPFHLFCMQYPDDAERIRSLGAEPEKVHVVGNLKFDLVSPEEENQDTRRRWRERLGLGGEALWVAGSTHPDEEKSLLEIFSELSKDYPHLRLLIAPRHPERAREVAKLIRTFRREAALFSENGTWKEGVSFIVVLDTVGQLQSLYAAADLVFIGGSLVRRGGQNLLEPAFFAKPILFGPHMENFRDVVHLFLREGAVIQIQNKEELKEKVKFLLQDESRGRALGEKARNTLFSNQGVVDRHLKYLEPFLTR